MTPHVTMASHVYGAISNDDVIVLLDDSIDDVILLLDGAIDDVILIWRHI